ncbi:uncharacterized protein M421DRAFT_74449 [Didymella exigua CBS 183.55]|uniref:Ricin B lectin domain-containing protein n=1 Tax=Didymella exigua CBS 183.55 TaxID=1150837 RepID=A0A6A5R6F5_9PLEO|nr:uncharacterized protein M421DRAFT_74449 [Didymella exigua CBS 183.55]KAF1923731.1 hypothetical protein M421DRAFT_74449 [Didymella exigua CBS 183.55]
MSDYSGPGTYTIHPKHAPNMSLDVWGGATSAGTPLKLYERVPGAKNHQFAIVAAGGTQGKPETGDREYLIIAVNSGLYVTTELRSPLDPSIRWKLRHTGNGCFYIDNVGTAKQLNVRGSGQGNGTEIITYAPFEAENSQFLLKAI